jgi:hypothetical protein
MSIVTQPQNSNYLQQTKYLLTFPRVSATQYFCQKVNLPGVSLDPLEQNTPFVDLYRPGNKISYDSFTATFIVDEDMRSWMEIHDWIKGLTFPENFAQYSNLKYLSDFTEAAPFQQYADGSLVILSALNNAKLTVNFADMFPVSISALDFDSTDEDTTTMTATATFKFSYYNITKN